MPRFAGGAVAEKQAAYQFNISDFNGLPEEFDQRVDFITMKGTGSSA